MCRCGTASTLSSRRTRASSSCAWPLGPLLPSRSILKLTRARSPARSSALDLSTHVANSTLSAQLSSIQARLAPHVNLFVLLFGLGSLFRDMERARQEAYRNSVRGAGEERAVRPAGIGERQPGKDELELALMRCVSLSLSVPRFALETRVG